MDVNLQRCSVYYILSLHAYKIVLQKCSIPHDCLFLAENYSIYSSCYELARNMHYTNAGIKKLPGG